MSKNVYRTYINKTINFQKTINSSSFVPIQIRKNKLMVSVTH